MTTELINTRTLTTILPNESPLALNQSQNYLFDLTYLGIVDVQGDKAIDFLQGQVSCDLRNLSDIHMMHGALCNLKGRILALLDIIQWQGVKLVLPNDLMESTQLSLSKTAMLSRVKLTANSNKTVLGFYLQNKDDLLPEGIFLPTQTQGQAFSEDYCVYHVGNGLYILLLDSGKAAELSNKYQSYNQLLGSSTWHGLKLLQKQIDIYPESRGLFLPHRLDLHETSVLSFDKGCYKGQEIIARTHYRATLKHGLKIAQIQTNQPIHSGQRLLQAEQGTEVGELIDYAVIKPGFYVVAVSVLKDAAGAVLFEGHSDVVDLC